jgi:hypothetical protein
MLEYTSNICNLNSFHLYNFHLTTNEYSTILYVKKLLHEFIIDAWATIKQVWLHWVEMNQTTLKVDAY